MKIFHHHTIQIGCPGCPACHARHDEVQRSASETSRSPRSLFDALSGLARLVATVSLLRLNDEDCDHEAIGTTAPTSPSTAASASGSATAPHGDDAIRETLRALFARAIERDEHSGGASDDAAVAPSPFEAAFLAAFRGEPTLA